MLADGFRTSHSRKPSRAAPVPVRAVRSLCSRRRACRSHCGDVVVPTELPDSPEPHPPGSKAPVSNDSLSEASTSFRTASPEPTGQQFVGTSPHTEYKCTCNPSENMEGVGPCHLGSLP
ncbi:hypothetical protein MRX96_020784 [Rhipicephalus microplus]